MSDRSAQVPNKTAVPLGLISDGEAYLQLVLQEAQILAAYYPEDIQMRKAVTIIKNGLTSNLTKGHWSLFDSQSTSAAGEAIKIANSINAKQGVKSSGYFQKNGIGDPIIQYETDCNYYLYDYPGNPSGGFTDPDYLNCMKLKTWAPLFNEHLENSGHYPMYEFKNTPDDMAATGAAKRLVHQAGIDAIVSDTGLDSSLIRQWYRLGILRKNAQNADIGPMQVEETIARLKFGAEQGIGVLPVAVVLAIIALISTAITATVQIVVACKTAKGAASAFSTNNPFGLPPYKPGTEDFPGSAGGGNGGGGTGSDNTLLYVGAAAAAAGLYFINQDK
jgi:hypothetical protein